MADRKVSIVEVHVRIDKKAEQSVKALSNRFRERALAALADANVEIMQKALVASSRRLNAKMKKNRAVGRLDVGDPVGGARRGLRWLLQQNDPIGNPASSVLKASYRGWEHGGFIGNPDAITRAGVQFYWRALDRGSSAQVGREMQGFMLGVGGQRLRPGGGVGNWAEGRSAVNKRGTGAFNAVSQGGPRFTIKRPVPSYEYLEAAEERLRELVSTGEALQIYQKHFDAHGLGQINLGKRGVGVLHSLSRARTIQLITRT